MTKTEALEASIQHWIENRDAETPGGVSLATKDCALCQMFRKTDCNGCPVKERTGNMRCYGSPYYAADCAAEMWLFNPDSPEVEAAFRKAAQAEVDFLKSLRKEA